MNSFFMAFSMFSRIPVPKVDWEKTNMKYILCFFPFVGIFIGICEYLTIILCEIFGFSNLFKAVLLTVLPVVITGGIHLDGFIDTCDAKHSWKGKDEKLKILSDSHVGAFAVIYLVSYMIFDFAMWYEAGKTALFIGCFGFVLSRVLSAFAAVKFKCAKNNGLLFTFKDSADSKFTAKITIMYFIIVSIFICYCFRFFGAVAVIVALLTLIYYRIFSYKEFGGVTGDLAGYFLQVCEALILLSAIIC
ncbi:MAG: adenosylcobinamide-GDP ribazoletransferase, partial [Clostridia bacterium]|nr:adenosylcobinamide-GDP ribazoletransferase [Clostridia bacterium]